MVFPVTIRNGSGLNPAHIQVIENEMRKFDFDGDTCSTDDLNSSEKSLISKMIEVWKEGISNNEEAEKGGKRNEQETVQKIL